MVEREPVCIPVNSPRLTPPPQEHDDEVDASMPLPYEYIYEADLEAKGWARLRLKTGAPRNQSQVGSVLNRAGASPADAQIRW